MLIVLGVAKKLSTVKKLNFVINMLFCSLWIWFNVYIVIAFKYDLINTVICYAQNS